MNGDSMPTMRNVADPNAPFTLRPEPPHLAQRQPILDVNDVPVCMESQLSLFETRSRFNGQNHTLRLTLENQGKACRLSGFPAITLLGANGAVISGVDILKVSAGILAATLQPTTGRPGAGPAEEPSPQVLLRPRGDAVFELGWTGGPDCTQVTRLAVSAPGNTEPSYVPRQLSLCGNRLMITAVAPGGAE